MSTSDHKWHKLKSREVPASIQACALLEVIDTINLRYEHTDCWVEEAYVCKATANYKVLVSWHTRRGEPDASQWYYIAAFGRQTTAYARWRQP